MADAVVIGSGAGASIAAMVLAENHWDVTILEKGPNYFTNLTEALPTTLFSNDELKHDRHFAKNLSG
jgi:choline dehydrogenase-like flavoprotein